MIPLSPWLDPTRDWSARGRPSIDLCHMMMPGDYAGAMWHDGLVLGPTWWVLDWLTWRPIDSAQRDWAEVVRSCLPGLTWQDHLQGALAYGAATILDPAMLALALIISVWIWRRRYRARRA